MYDLNVELFDLVGLALIREWKILQHLCAIQTISVKEWPNQCEFVSNLPKGG